MTTMFTNSFTCVNCNQTSKHAVLGSTNAFGSSDLDLRPPPMQRHTMNTWLMHCPFCSYVAPELDTATGDLTLVTNADYLALLNDETFPELARQFRAFAFLVAAEPLRAGRAYIHAAWVCDDNDQPGEAIACRKRAADCMMQVKTIDNTERGVTTGAVLVDVLRRSEQFIPALAVVQELLGYDACQAILRQIVLFQQRLIEAHDTKCYTVDQALESAL